MRPAVFSRRTRWGAVGTPSSVCDHTPTRCQLPHRCQLLSPMLPARSPDLASTRPVLRAMPREPGPDRACALRKVTLVPGAWGHSRKPFLDPRVLKCRTRGLCRGSADTWAVSSRTVPRPSAQKRTAWPETQPSPTGKGRTPPLCSALQSDVGPQLPLLGALYRVPRPLCPSLDVLICQVS